ncbi:hypothetical protein HU200_022879 [Digitaria exilis]|uniref:Uncharacterized protein n=1 Tax=Digitaria exilis TaxID=1010633 RepID=A0A835EX68_9POAL|nr:hypothetical protein HU200_022879 [Digitaria exilis]
MRLITQPEETEEMQMTNEIMEQREPPETEEAEEVQMAKETMDQRETKKMTMLPKSEMTNETKEQREPEPMTLLPKSEEEKEIDKTSNTMELYPQQTRFDMQDVSRNTMSENKYSTEDEDQSDINDLENNVMDNEIPDHDVDLINSLPNLENDEKKTSRHRKPKKDHTSIAPQDYECDDEDYAVIKSIVDSPEKKIIVRVNESFVTYSNIKCLLHPKLLINGDVINPYIECMRAEDHLLFREGATVYLENTLISYILWRDGKFQKENTQTKKTDVIVERIITYVTNDMLQGIQRQIEITIKEIKDLDFIKWPDLNILSWPVIEIFKKQMQEDRLKLAAILLQTQLNTARGSEEIEDNSIEEDENPEDCEMLESSEALLHGLKTQIKNMKVKEVAAVICKYIMSINDEETLRKEWIKSSKPHPISITLKKLKEILDELCNFRRHHKFRTKLDIENLTKLFQPYPDIGIPLSDCQMERKIYIIDIMPIPYWGPKDDPSRYYLDGIQKIGVALGRAMEETDPTWNDDVYDWRRNIPNGVPKTTDK